MRRFMRFLFLWVIGLTATAAFAGNLKWSIVVYAATAEKELAQYIDPIISELINMEVPADTELLLQNDTYGANTVKRMVKRPQGQEKGESKALPKHDSSSPEVFSEFLDWAHRTAQGERKLLMILTHSWGWRGIILNSDFPDDPDKVSIMPIRTFGDLLEKSPLKFDVVLLDSCIDGNAEVLEDLKNTTQYLVFSQRETPFCSFSFHSLYKIFAKSPDISSRNLAKTIPVEYVKDYSREGGMAKKEGEYDIVTLTAVDTKKWDPFVENFASFVNMLSKKGMKDKLKQTPKWFKSFADDASNVDLVEFLKRIPDFMDSDHEIANRAKDLIQSIGYPEKVDELSGEKLHLSKKHIRSLTMNIEADDHVPADKLLEKCKLRWKLNNLDILSQIPRNLRFSTQTIDNKRFFSIELDSLRESFDIRPWLPGTLNVTYKFTDRKGRTHKRKLSRDNDYYAVTEFPEASFMLSEAHTNGAPFIHGIGLMLNPLLSSKDDDDEDGKGPNPYKSTAWNKKTSWGDLVIVGGKDKELMPFSNKRFQSWGRFLQ